MLNNLIFINGAVLPICPTDAADAPRMGAGFRGWHIEAAHADAVEALAGGIAAREYESITGMDDDGNAVTELLREDLSGYAVPGGVWDHMDGTVTVWARQRSETETAKAERDSFADGLAALGVDTVGVAESVEKRLVSLRELTAAADLTDKHDVIVDLPPMYCGEWVPDAAYKRGQIVAYNAVKYLLLQDVTAQAHFPPDMENGAMLAIYKPYQGRERYTWLYGEYTEIGFTRYDGAELYVCTADPGANIYPPSMVPACWTLAPKE